MVLEQILLVLALVTGLLVLVGKLKQMPEGRSTFVDYGRSLFPVIMIVFVLRSFIVEPFRIPSGSMLPTLHLGDFILVNKAAYGLRLPIIYHKIFRTGSPDRGDVMVFRFPENPKINFIKRVVGLPGDKLRVLGRNVYINGEKVKHELLDGNHQTSDIRGGYVSNRYLEQLDDMTHDILMRRGGRGSRGFDGVVPEGHYFVLGDNRDNSRDSRYWGFVPEENLVGRAFFIWFAWDVVNGGGVDWSRIGTAID
jgi:signal peptidase I